MFPAYEKLKMDNTINKTFAYKKKKKERPAYEIENDK